MMNNEKQTGRNKWQERIAAEKFLAELVKAGFVVPRFTVRKGGK